MDRFIKINIGNAVVEIKMTKFGTLIIGIIILIIVNIVLGEFARKNRELKKEKAETQRVIKELEKRDKELKDLREFKKLMDAIKDLSRGEMKDKERLELSKVIYRESTKYKYDWRMIVAVIAVESDFDRLMVTNNSYGLMQVRFMTGQESGSHIGLKLHNEEELHGITKNVRLGSFYLLKQIMIFGGVREGLVAYNMGPNKLRKIYKRIGSKKLETAYVRVVFRYYNYLRKNYG
jgi:hypothetical protein